VGWWPGNGNAEDVVGGHDGHPRGDTSFAPGMVDQAFSFDGRRDRVAARNARVLNPRNRITLDAWIFRTGKGAQYAYVITKDGDTGRQYFLEATPSPQHLRVFVVVDGGGWRYFDGATIMQLNTWYHVAMTYDGATLKAYVNGALDGSMPVSGKIVRTSERVRIGAAGNTHKYDFQGLIDEADVFNRALSAEEVLSIYTAGAEGKCLPQGQARRHKMPGFLTGANVGQGCGVDLHSS
jgi:hypothetical protein